MSNRWVAILCLAFLFAESALAQPVRKFDDPGAPPFKVLKAGENPPLDAYDNFVIGPEYTAAPERKAVAGVPQGKVKQFIIDSKETKLFNPGIARKVFGKVDPKNPRTLIVETHPIDYKRQITVYVPAQYQAGSEAPFMIVHDGPSGKPGTDLPRILDNLIAQKRIPPIVVIWVANGGGDAQGHERGKEYDTMSGAFADYIEAEVLPRVEKNCDVKLTKDPDGRAAMGNSSGGSAALIMAWYRPNLYRRVLTTSGTFVNQQWPFDSETPGGAWDFHETLIPKSDKKPLRIFISVGDRDLLNPNVMRDNMHDWVEANHRMAKVLKAKGYEYQYLFCRNAGHSIGNAQAQFLPHAIEWVWRGYPVKQTKAAEPQTDLEALVDGNNQFAFDMYARLAKEKGNIIFSPYSISSALAMTYGGARGETAKQMAKTLRFALPEQQLHAAFGGLTADLGNDQTNRPFDLHVANALWGQQGFPFLNDFLELNRKHYSAGLRLVDFAGTPDESRQTINRWVEEQTRDKIRELLQPGVISSDTRLVLTNAIYMKAKWQVRFNRDQTTPGEFAVSDDHRPEVPLMWLSTKSLLSTKSFRYFTSDNFDLLKLDYEGKRLSMAVLLPRSQSLPELEKSLTPAAFENALAKAAVQPVSVCLPRFKATHRVNLEKELNEMGMPLAFSRAADFSGMTTGERLLISRVVHKAFIEVDETGTEAAAATGVAMRLPSAPKTIQFHANRPFLFVIRDDATRTILFMGRVSDPSR